MPPSATDQQQYDGNLISGLQRQVIAAQQSVVDALSAAIEKEKRDLYIIGTPTYEARSAYLHYELMKRQPWDILVSSCGHICNRVMEGGDVFAWFIIKAKIDQLLLENSN